MDTPSDYLTPDEVTDVEIRSKRRGLDPAAVEAHLRSVADSMRDLLSDNLALSDEVANLRSDLDQSSGAAVATGLSDQPAGPDEDEIRVALEAEASRIVGEARAEADRLLVVADEKARHIVAEAESVFAERSMKADVELQALQAAAFESHRDEMARTETESAHMIEEARVVRSQILQDLARRRTLARRQIDQLRAGRERLIASYETIRTVLEDLGAELHVSMAEARTAAQSAGQSVPESSIEDLEAEIEAARLNGLLDTGRVPVVDDSPKSEEDAPTESSTAEARGDDYVETDSTVTELFERIRSDQERHGDDPTADDSAPAPEAPIANNATRGKDSIKHR